MTTLALLMFNRDETEGTARNIARLRAVVDEVVVVDSSSPTGNLELRAAVEPLGAHVYRALPLGHPEPLRPFGVSKVTADYIFLLDADEEPSPGLVEQLRKLTEHKAYVIPRFEVELHGFTHHLRLFRRDAVHFAGRSFDFPVVEGTVGHLDRAHAILHHAHMDTYFSDKSRAKRYFVVENYERPFTRRYLTEALSLRTGTRTLPFPLPRRDPDRPLSPPAVRAVIEIEFARDLLLGRGIRAAAFNRRYSLGKASFLLSLPEAERVRVAEIARDLQRAGGLFPFLDFANPEYVDRLTASFAWDRSGLEVYEDLLAYRHEQGRPADRISPRLSTTDPLPAVANDDRPQMAVVIPTHDRPEKLRALLRSLLTAHMGRLESVVIVDDSRNPVNVAMEFPELPVRHIVLEHRAFISRAKNIGWRATRAPFVFFIDDDNVVTRDTLEQPLDTMSSSPDIGAVVPSVLYKDRPELVWVYATPFAADRWGHTLIGRNLPRNPGLEGKLFDTDAMPNAALVRREALEDIGGFQEALEVNSSADAALRLKAKGWGVLAYSGAFIYHDVEPPGRVGYWARHGATDPERVFHEVRDWFMLMRSLHAGERLFAVRATWHALGFLLPNGTTYLVRGGARGRRAFRALVRGYLSGLRGAGSERASALLD